MNLRLCSKYNIRILEDTLYQVKRLGSTPDLIITCVTLSKAHNFSEPQFIHQLENSITICAFCFSNLKELFLEPNKISQKAMKH